MSEVTQDAIGDSADSSGAGLNGASGADSKVENQKHEEFTARLLSEKKREQAKRVALESRLQEMEQKTLEAEGKKDELIAHLRKEKTVLIDELKEIAYETVSEQVKAQAERLGCRDSDLFLKAIDLQGVTVQEGKKFKVDKEVLTKTIEEVRKSKPWMFEVEAPGIRDGMPSNSKSKNGGKVDFQKMTTAELKEYAKKSGLR